MGKKRKTSRSRHGLQVITLCISTAMVLVLLGMVVFSVLTARNLSTYVKENLVVTMMLQDDITNPEAQQLCSMIHHRPYIKKITYISKEAALKEQTAAMGTDPSEFIGTNPFLASIELQLKGDYANTDSLKWITKELKKYPKVGDITYQQALVNSVNDNLQKISLVLFVLAVLLTFVSFSLINNTVRLGIYARRFSIHTMKLVGASWSFIRYPFVVRAIVVGMIAALVAIGVLGACAYALYSYEPGVLTVVTWDIAAITAISVFLFGIIITAICSSLSVNKFLKMKAGDLYKI
ncbi:cell division protein FtsX [Segatella paludivivens]|uniref:cell division protein FtsX n=1 Tax=Segatella paludivivens TaxID=185294 RepID=UPI0003702F32|nr:permease-like cell division protein FtsX [Segatella paludivivens]